MFGYVQVRKPELKIKDYDAYHACYCGLCKALKKNYGIRGQVTLTYDMTFLVLLLSSLYDIPFDAVKEHCIVHPAKKQLKWKNEISDYAAHINIILSYYHLKDDFEDESSKKALLGMQLYKKSKEKIAKKYPRQDKAIRENLKKLAELEKNNEQEVLTLADCFGKLMAEVFVYKEDFFQENLRKTGYHLGRFIYIMDAYDDLARDREKGCFNPFISKADDDEKFDRYVEDILIGEMSESAAAYQKLPCLEYKDILGNILYAGVWNRFDDMKRKQGEDKKSEEK